MIKSIFGSFPLLLLFASSLLLAEESSLEVVLDAHLNDLAIHEGRIHAAGRSGKLLTLDSSGFWHVHEEGGDRRNWLRMAAGGGRLVATGSQGEIAVSDDGQEWQTLLGVTTKPLRRVIYEADAFWGVGKEGYLCRSVDGLQWDVVPTGIDIDLRGIAYGNDSWVVVGKGGIFTSPDAVEWTQRISDTQLHFHDVVYGSQGFVVVESTKDRGSVYRSSNGVSWSEKSLGVPALRFVNYGNGRYVVTGGMGDRIKSVVSENSIEWEPHEVPYFTTFSRTVFADGMFRAVGAGASLLSSPDGETWQADVPTRASSLWGVADAGGESLVAVGETGKLMKRSPDGEWASLQAGTSRWLWDVTSGGGILLAVGDRGVILRSVDGDEWQTVRNPDAAPRLGGVAFGDGVFVAVGDEGTVVRSSHSPTTWLDETLPASSMFWSVAYGDGKFLAVGENGSMAISEDTGLTWEAVPFDETVSLHSVVFQEGIGFSVSGSNGFTAHSADGSDWILVPSITDKSWEGSAIGTGWTVAVGEDEIVGISSDGKEWELLGSAVGGSLHDVVVRWWGATAVGSDGAIYDFPLPPMVRDHSGDITVETNGEIFLSAEPGGTGPFTYQWSLDGVDLPSETEATLRVSRAERDSIGEYRLQIISDAGTVVSAPFFVTVLTSYDAWAAENISNPSEAGPEQDSAGQGVENLLAYAFDSAPESARILLPLASVERLVVDGSEDDYRTLTFSRAIGAEDLVYLPEVSSDLTTWEPVAPDQVIRLSRDGSREYVTTRDIMPSDENSRKRFFRLRVQLAD